MRRIVHLMGTGIVALALTGCEHFIAIDVPHDQLVPAAVFTDDALANGAVAGIYQEMSSSRTTHFASGGINSVTALMDVATGVLDFNFTDANVGEFSAGTWLPTNSRVYTLWTSAYKTIFRSNEVLEGLAIYSGVTPYLADQLRGEALFIRAFTHMQLVQLFGAVPLVLTADYRVTQRLPRSEPTEVYEQVEKDLIQAMELLPVDYTHAQDERVRPNRWAAAMLLARMYAYQQQWADAAMAATAVLEQTSLYGLVPTSEVYLKNNREAIWQLMVVGTARATNEGLEVLPNLALTTPPRFSFSPEVLKTLEDTDARRIGWIGSYTMANGVDSYYYIHKYKIRENPVGLSPNEYGMVLRLTEAYLIRAEARVELADADGALTDLNAVRVTHGELLPLTELDRDAMIVAIERERLIEFAYEWGHRWADLKRWGRNDKLLPIPQQEREANPFLEQNPDY